MVSSTGRQTRFAWYQKLGIQPERLRLREHGSDELAHYAKGCADVEYQFPFGWSELEGIANRTRLRPEAARASSAARTSRYFDEETQRALRART